MTSESILKVSGTCNKCNIFDQVFGKNKVLLINSSQNPSEMWSGSVQSPCLSCLSHKKQSCNFVQYTRFTEDPAEPWNHEADRTFYTGTWSHTHFKLIPSPEDFWSLRTLCFLVNIYDGKHSGLKSHDDTVTRARRRADSSDQTLFTWLLHQTVAPAPLYFLLRFNLLTIRNPSARSVWTRYPERNCLHTLWLKKFECLFLRNTMHIIGIGLNHLLSLYYYLP